MTRSIRTHGLGGLLIVGLLAGSFIGCSDDPAQPQETDVNTYSGVVASGGVYERVTPSEEVTNVSEDEETRDDGSVWVCTVETRSVVDAPDDYATFDPNSEVIFPGSLLQGATLSRATPEPIAVRRAPGTISIDLLNGSSGVFREVPEVTHSEVIQAMNEIVADNSGTIPAAFTFRMSEVQSREQMALAMSVNVDTWTTDVSGDLAFSSDRSYNRFLVILNQRFYTMSFDFPTSLDEVFAPDVTPAELVRYIQDGNPATYVSSVTYGRQFYLLVESTASRTKLEASVNASYSAAVAGGEMEIDATYVKDLENVRIKVFAMGGDSQSALGTFNGDFNAIQEFLTEGGSIDTGVPLSYVVRNVYDNTTVNVKVATEYDIRTCEILVPGVLSSDFEDGFQGWSGYGDYTNLRRWSSQFLGGNIAASDRATGQTWYFRAPVSYHGDWSTYYGGSISYYMMISAPSSQFVADDVIIVGRNNQTISWRMAAAQQPTNQGFALYEVALDPRGGWRYAGRTATEAEIRQVLSDVTDVRIRGEYVNGADWGALDEVNVTPPAGDGI